MIAFLVFTEHAAIYGLSVILVTAAEHLSWTHWQLGHRIVLWHRTVSQRKSIQRRASLPLESLTCSFSHSPGVSDAHSETET